MQRMRRMGLFLWLGDGPRPQRLEAGGNGAAITAQIVDVRRHARVRGLGRHRGLRGQISDERGRRCRQAVDRYRLAAGQQGKRQEQGC